MHANIFQPINESAKKAFGAITICCRDCNVRVRWAKAVEDNWSTCETAVNDDQTKLDYMCPDCVESLMIEINEQIATQANDVNGDQS